MKTKKLVAQSSMKEFDPECELHKPLLIVKAIDPGCTKELQIENCLTGRVVRLTTTESSENDLLAFRNALMVEFYKVFVEALQ